MRTVSVRNIRAAVTYGRTQLFESIYTSFLRCVAVALLKMLLHVQSMEMWRSIPLELYNFIQTAPLALEALPILDVPSCAILIEPEDQSFAARICRAQQHNTTRVGLCTQRRICDP